jgi:hypothetical protein
VTEPSSVRPSVVTPPRVVLVAVAYLVLAWGAVYVVDVAQLTAAADWLGTPVWINLFHESFLTELLQWAMLVAAALTAGYLGGQLRDAGDRRLAGFWTVLAAGLTLMLIEDSGNPRHALGQFVEEALGLPSFTVNLVLLGAIALTLLYALVAHWRPVWARPRLRTHLLAAYAVYGVAGFLSGTGPRWYPLAGAQINARLFGGRLPEADTVDGSQEFLIMDLMVEESVEIVGAALFLAVAVTAAGAARSAAREPAPPRPAPAPSS